MDVRLAIASKAARNGLTVVTCTLLTLAISSEASASVSLASPESPSRTLKQSINAATKEGSARITVQFVSGSATGRVVQDSSLSRGKQTTAIGRELASVLLVGGAAYISGNDKALTSYYSFPSSVVTTLNGRWVAVRSTDSAFNTVSANVALPAALSDVTPAGLLIAGTRSKVNGRWTNSVSGEAPGGGARLTLFVSANSRSLPVEAVETSGTGKSRRAEIVTFTRWGERVDVSAPSGAIPISTLRSLASASG